RLLSLIPMSGFMSFLPSLQTLGARPEIPPGPSAPSGAVLESGLSSGGGYHEPSRTRDDVRSRDSRRVPDRARIHPDRAEGRGREPPLGRGPAQDRGHLVRPPQGGSPAARRRGSHGEDPSPAGHAETPGTASPRQVGRVFEPLFARVPGLEWTLHTHDTRAMAIPNILAAMECGVTHFDSSIGGLGGCPFAPGASGNVCSEDLVHCLDAMGVETGIDLDKLIAASRRVQAIVERTLPGQIIKAGKATRRYPLPDGVAARLPGRMTSDS